MDNINSSEKIRSLSITLQKLATKLCHKLYNEEPGNPALLSGYLPENEINLRGI
jgi:hypothetical protein